MSKSPPQDQNSKQSSDNVTVLSLTLTISYTNGINNSGGYTSTFDSSNYDFANSINVPCTLNCSIAKASNVLETFSFVGIGWTNTSNVTVTASTSSSFSGSSLSLIIDFLVANDATDITFVIEPSAGGIFLADPQEDNDPPALKS